MASATDLRRIEGVTVPVPLAGRRLSRRVVMPVTVIGFDTMVLLGVVGGIRGFSPGSVVLALLIAAALIMVLPGPAVRIDPRASDDLPGIVGAVAAALLVIGPLVGIGPATAPAGALVLIAALAAGRCAAYGSVRSLQRRRQLRERTVVAGGGRLAVEIAQIIAEHPEYGLDLVAVTGAPEASAGGGAAGQGVRSLGPVSGIVPALEAIGAERLILAFGEDRDADLVALVRACARLPVEIHVVPRFFELGVSACGHHGDALWGIPLIRLARSLHRPAGRRAKRILDVVLAAIALIVSAPVFALVAVAVRLSGPGPILFRQLRIGAEGRPFWLVKFRSMEVNDDADHTWSVAGDQRVTSVGRGLRRTGLDELPQLLNVLRGDMSLVGPRPERPFFIKRYGSEIPGYIERLRVPGGITGWAQVHGLRGDTSVADRARFDNFYAEHWSPWRDIAILMNTAAALCRRSRG